MKKTNSNKRKKTTFRPTQKQLVLVSVVAMVVALGAGILLRSYAATGSATLTISPTTISAIAGTNFTVTIIESSGTAPVNAVQADISYDTSQLQYIGTDTSASPFTLVASSVGGNGKVTIASATTVPQTGAQTVATVTFKALGGTSSLLSILPTSGVVSSVDNTSILSPAISTAIVNYADTVAPTTPGTAVLTSNTSSSISLSWSAATDNVGVTGYKIYINGSQVGTSATNSYTATGLRSSTSYNFTTSAYDANNNNSVQSPASTLSTLGKSKSGNPHH